MQNALHTVTTPGFPLQNSKVAQAKQGAPWELADVLRAEDGPQTI